MTETYDSINIAYSDADYSYEGEAATEEAKKVIAGNHSVGYKYEIYNEQNGSSFVINYLNENDEGIGLVRTPDFTADIRNKEQVKEGQHGVIGFRSFYGARAISFDCQIIAETATNADIIIENIKRTLALPSYPSNDDMGNVRIRWTDVQGKKWQIYARVVADPQPSSQTNMWLIHSMQLQLKAYNPVIYSQEENTITGNQGWIQGAFYLNTDLPLQIPYAYNYKVTVDNQGTFQTPTSIKLYGYAKRPTVYNITTEALIVIDYEIQDNDYITIDSINGTITSSDGVDIASLTTSDDVFIFLDTGINEIIYYDSEIENNPYLTGKSGRIDTVSTETILISPTSRNRLFIDDFDTFNSDGSWVISNNYLFETGTALTTSSNSYNDDDDYILIENDDRTSQDWSDLYDNGVIRLKLNIDDVSDIDSVDFIFGSSDSDYWYVNETDQYDGSAFSNGDNILEFDLTGTSSTGSPDETDITYMAVKINSDFSSTINIEIDDLHHYSDLWTLSGNSYDDTNYKLEDHGVKITSTSGDWSYASLSRNITLANVSLDDILMSYQYVDDYSQLQEYKIRFGDDTDYIEANLEVPTASGWKTNNVRFSDFTTAGIATISGSFTELRLYAQAIATGSVNVTFAGIYHLNNTDILSTDDQKIIINWRDATI